MGTEKRLEQQREIFPCDSSVQMCQAECEKPLAGEQCCGGGRDGRAIHKALFCTQLSKPLRIPFNQENSFL